MTDRLKAWLNKARNCPTDHAAELYDALRTVVELHEDRAGECGHCSSFDYEGLSGCAWPCPTIKAIEKEVFGDE